MTKTRRGNKRARRRQQLYKGEVARSGGGAEFRRRTTMCSSVGSSSPSIPPGARTKPVQATIAHLPKANSASSARIRAAHYKSTADAEDKRTGHGRTIKNRERRTKKKTAKIKNEFIEVNSCIPPSIKKLRDEEMDKFFFVIDGGDKGNPPIAPDPTGLTYLNKELRILRISDGDLYTPPTTDPEEGLIYQGDDGGLPLFMLLPRKAALRTTGMDGAGGHSILVDAMADCESVTKCTLHRGNERLVFKDEDRKYNCMSMQPCRGERGVKPSPACTSSPEDSFNTVCTYIRACERILQEYCPTKELRRMYQAKKLLQYQGMIERGHHKYSESCIYGGIAFARNVFLNIHTDQDFAYSMTTVHQRRDYYNWHDEVVTYFAFPRLGVAVPLRPGDILVFDPQEPHAISSRCRNNDDIYCVSLYLKSAIVGGNDNSLPASSEVEELDKRYKLSLNN